MHSVNLAVMVRGGEKTVTISVRVKESMRDKLVVLAKERRRTVSQLIAFAIEDWYASGGDKKKLG